MNTFNSTHYLTRSGIYSSPKADNEGLPVVYGDLTDGTAGIWFAPLIDTGNYVYAYAGHETLSVANGNSISVYVDGVLTPSGWTFNEADNYESLGTISTITFSADQGNAKISVRGKGKPTTSGGAALMENVVDIVEDFMITEAAVATGADFDSATKARARLTFIDQNYTAAGVIKDDTRIWDTVRSMMNTFAGDAYVDVSNKLVLVIRTAVVDQTRVADVFGSGDIKFLDAKVQADSLLNRIPFEFAFNYAESKFSGYTDAEGAADAASVNLYGTRRPDKPWRGEWTRDITSALGVQAVLVNRHKSADRVWRIRFQDNTLKRIHAGLGDYLLGTFDLLYDANGEALVNQYFEVLEITGSFSNDTVVFDCLNTGAYRPLLRKYDGTVGKYDGTVGTYGADRDTTVYE